jgi:hypothetical protein
MVLAGFGRREDRVFGMKDVRMIMKEIRMIMKNF